MTSTMQPISILESLEPVLSSIIVSVYDGEIDESTGRYQGYGAATLDNKTTYEGDFSNGLFHGKGKYTWTDNITYEGDFLYGYVTGIGVYTWPDGTTYSGQVYNSLRHGNGIFASSSGQSYDGRWQSGKRYGKGKMIYNNKSTIVYTGDWIDGLRDGYGIMRYNSGNVYEGYWHNDKKCGRGLMLWKDLDEIYGGDWIDDQPHGNGEHIWCETGSKSLTRQMCNIYRGSFAHGLRSGTGTFFYSNGSQYSGQWSNNMKNGVGIYAKQSGEIIVNDFINDRFTVADSIRTTDDVSIQIKLNINDVLAGLDSTKATSSSSPSTVLQNIERLILRYNSYLKSFFKKYSEMSVKSKLLSKEKDMALTDPYISDWPKVERVIYQARSIHNRHNCTSLSYLRRFIHEVGLFTCYCNSYDLTRCFLQMHEEHKRVAFILSTQHSCDSNSSSDNRMIELMHILEYPLPAGAGSIPSSHEYDPRQPVRESEFVEMIVRVIAESYSRTVGSSGTTSLYDYTFQILAKQLYPFYESITNGHISSISSSSSSSSSAVYYDSSVQTSLNTSEYLNSVWDGIVQQSNNEPRVGNVYNIFKQMSANNEIDKTLTVSTFLSIIYTSTDTDVTLLRNRIDKEDYHMIVCKVVSSSMWTLRTQRSNSDASADASATGEEKGDTCVNPEDAADGTLTADTAAVDLEAHMKAEERLVYRLVCWFQSIKPRECTTATADASDTGDVGVAA